MDTKLQNGCFLCKTFSFLYISTMADDSDEEQLGEEQLKEEEAVPEKPKKIFINHIDSYHGKNVARVSDFN